MVDAMLVIDAACYFSTLIVVIKNTYIMNWQAFYAKMVHYFWTLFLYVNLFIYGTVWDSKVDQGIAVGYISQIMFEVNIEYAKS